MSKFDAHWKYQTHYFFAVSIVEVFIRSFSSLPGTNPMKQILVKVWLIYGISHLFSKNNFLFLDFTRSNEFYRVGSRWSIKRWMSPSNSLDFQTVRNELFLNYSITITKWQVKHYRGYFREFYKKLFTRYTDQNWANICTQN